VRHHFAAGEAVGQVAQLQTLGGVPVGIVHKAAFSQNSASTET
jgi:hypothetical protein